MVFSAYNSLKYFVQRHLRSLWPFLNSPRILNILIAYIEMKSRRIVCRSKPFMYRIDPSSLCNLRCPFCDASRIRTRQKRTLDMGDYKKMVNKVRRYAVRISLYELGEPLMNKSIYKMIKWASDRHISSLISTNFNLFRKEHLDALFESRLTILEPCLDGFTQENYIKYRIGGNVEAVKDGIRMVMERKRSALSKWPIVDVQVINFDHLKDEIPSIDRFLKECRVDKITYRQENYGFNSPETTILNREVQSSSACFWLYFGMTIRPDGSVYPCCGRGFERFSYGNILKEDPFEIWNNRYYRFSRSLFNKGPDLVLTDDFKDIPCLTCHEYKKLRGVKKSFPKP